MKKITLLLFALGIFTAFGFTILQGGDNPIPGIDIIMKEDPSLVPIMNLSMDDTSLKELSALEDEERSIYLSKYLTPIFEKATNEKGLEKVILKGLLQNRCIECKSFETFTFKVPSNYKKNGYTVTFNIKFDTKWISVITDRENFEKPIANPHNFELIDTVNELESKLKPEEKKELVEKFKNEFYRIEGHLGKEYKTKEQVFNAYISILKNIPPPAILEERIKHNAIEDVMEILDRKKERVSPDKPMNEKETMLLKEKKKQ